MTGIPLAPSRVRWFLTGARDTVPMLVGAAPFGLIFGTLAAASPLAAWQGELMSLAVFAGSSQFIAIGLISGGSGLVVVWLTTAIVNLRHLLYAAALLPQLGGLPRGWRLGLGFLLTDEVFAVLSRHYQLHPHDPDGHWYGLGSGLAMYLNWQAWTILGLWFGAGFPQLQHYGLDFAMTATFLAIVVPQLNAGPHLGAACAAGVLAWFGRGLPYNLGLLLAVAAGMVVGVGLARRQRRGASP